MPPSMYMFLGIELAVEQLRASLVDENLELVGVECVDFDTDCSEYATQGGIFTSPGEAYTTPVEMWIKGLDLLLEKLHRNHDLSRVRAIGGCAQHALVWWKSTTIPSLSSLDPHLAYHHHFPAASFSLPQTPTALDTSSHAHALAIESLLGGAHAMSQLVGTSATPSLVAGQMLRVREGWIGEVWARTGRVQFASSFLSSLIMGKWVGMVESEACATGMWVHRSENGGHWSDQILDIIGGSREEGRRVRGWLGEVDTSGGRRVGSVSRYLTERYGFDPDTLVFPFIPHALSTYLSLSSACDPVLNFGPIDTLMAPASSWVPSKSYQLLPHPCFDVTDTTRTSTPYVAILSSRNADVPRALVRDMYTKSWSAFDRLVEVVSPGGSIGLDDKLFSFYHLQGDVWPFSHVKGIYRFETGVKVQEFRDLRANPRCLVESQILSFRVKWSTLVSTGPVLRKLNGGRNTMGVGGLPGPTPTRLICTGAAANFPSIVSILADVFNSVILVPATQVDAAQVPNEAHRNAPPKGYPGRASVGAAWFARWGWGSSTSGSAASSTGSSPVWGEPRRGTPSLLAQNATNYEDEIRRLLNKRWVLSGATWGRTNAGGLHAGNQVGGTPYGTVRSSLANSVFKEEDEDELVNRVVGGGSYSPSSASFRDGEIGRLRTSSTTDTLSTLSGGLSSPSTTYTSPDPNLGMSSLLAPAPATPTPTTPTPLTPILPIPTPDTDAQMGLVKIAEPDVDAHLMYGSIVPEFCRLEGMVIKGIV